jgi:hypothetical protein
MSFQQSSRSDIAATTAEIERRRTNDDAARAVRPHAESGPASPSRDGGLLASIRRLLRRSPTR